MRRFNFAVLAVSAFAVLTGCDSSRLLDPSLTEASMARQGSEPVAPSNLIAAALSTTEIRIDWQDNSTNEVMFEVYRSTPDSTGPYAAWGTAGADLTGYIDAPLDAPLTEGTQYCYRVRSVVRKGSSTNLTYSAFSNTACATTPVTPPPPPPPPLALPAAPSAVGAFSEGTQVNVEWMDNASNEDGFRIDRSMDAEASWVAAGTVGADMRRFTDTGRAPEVQLCYRVVAFNAAGESASPTVCRTPLAAPTNLTGTQVDSLAYDLRWVDNSAVETWYEVWRYVSYSTYCPPDGEVACDAGTTEGEEQIATLPANSTSYRCADCTTGVLNVWVRATNQFGYSAPANWTVTP